MKRFYFSALLLFFLLFASLFNAHISLLLTEDLSARLEQAQQLAESGRWDHAEALTQQAYETWQSHHAYLHIFMRHSDTDEIQRSFFSVLEYLSLEEIVQYAAANADLTAQIRLLSEMEQPSLVNVL